jgi:long-chain acyl-CoA synthetase
VHPGEAHALAAPAVAEAVLKRIEGGLQPFPAHARVRGVWLTLDPWTIENGLITPTMKLKRAELEKCFAAAIAALYQAGRPETARLERDQAPEAAAR